MSQTELSAPPESGTTCAYRCCAGGTQCVQDLNGTPCRCCLCGTCCPEAAQINRTSAYSRHILLFRIYKSYALYVHSARQTLCCHIHRHKVDIVDTAVEFHMILIRRHLSLQIHAKHHLLIVKRQRHIVAAVIETGRCRQVAVFHPGIFYACDIGKRVSAHLIDIVARTFDGDRAADRAYIARRQHPRTLNPARFTSAS